MEFKQNQQLAFIFGLLGNIVSFMVFLAPIPTFYTIYKRKSSNGFQSIPYVVALLSATLLLYYGVLKTNANLIVSINGIGCAIEIAYLIMYLTYAPNEGKVITLTMILAVDVGAFALVLVITIFLLSGSTRVSAVGWICAIFNIAVFAAPLSIMRQVIRTKSVEYMPFSLSFFLTLSATMWFFYGIFVNDYYIALPNVLGFLFGVGQMILYLIYKNSGGKKDDDVEEAKMTINDVEDMMMELPKSKRTSLDIILSSLTSSTNNNRPKLVRSASDNHNFQRVAPNMMHTFAFNKLQNQYPNYITTTTTTTPYSAYSAPLKSDHNFSHT